MAGYVFKIQPTTQELTTEYFFYNINIWYLILKCCLTCKQRKSSPLPEFQEVYHHHHPHPADGCHL